MDNNVCTAVGLHLPFGMKEYSCGVTCDQYGWYGTAEAHNKSTRHPSVRIFCSPDPYPTSREAANVAEKWLENQGIRVYSGPILSGMIG